MESQPNFPQPDQQSYHPKHHIKVYVWIALVVASLLVAINGYLYFLRLSYLEQGARTAQEAEQKIQELKAQRLDTSDWKIYRNEENGFEFKYPENWWLNETKSTLPAIPLDIHLYNFKLNDDSLSCYTNFEGMEIQAGLGWSNKNDFKQSVESQVYPAGIGLYPSGKIEELFIDNHQVFKVENSGWGSECRGPGYFIKQDINKYIYIFTGAFDPKNNILDQIISTFRFVDKTTLTPDQIFQEVSSQLSVARSQLNYFIIFGQNRAQFSFGSGTNFAYKYDGKWYLAGDHRNSQSVRDCYEYDNVPEQYRPVCYDASTGQNKYMYSDGESINYPRAQAIPYIRG